MQVVQKMKHEQRELQTSVSTPFKQAFARMRKHRSILSKGTELSGFHQVNDYSYVLLHFWFPTFLLFFICLIDTHHFKANEVPPSSRKYPLLLRSLVHSLSLHSDETIIYSNSTQLVCCNKISYMFVCNSYFD